LSFVSYSCFLRGVQVHVLHKAAKNEGAKVRNYLKFSTCIEELNKL